MKYQTATPQSTSTRRPSVQRGKGTGRTTLHTPTPLPTGMLGSRPETCKQRRPSLQQSWGTGHTTCARRSPNQQRRWGTGKKNRNTAAPQPTRAKSDAPAHNKTGAQTGKTNTQKRPNLLLLNLWSPQALFWSPQALFWSPQALLWSPQALFWSP